VLHSSREPWWTLAMLQVQAWWQHHKHCRGIIIIIIRLFPTPPLFDVPAQWEPVRTSELNLILNLKLEGWGKLLYPNFNRSTTVCWTGGQTDGRAIKTWRVRRRFCFSAEVIDIEQTQFPPTEMGENRSKIRPGMWRFSVATEFSTVICVSASS